MIERHLHELAHTVSQAQNLEELTRPLLQLLQRVSGLESAYLTRIDEVGGIQEILYARNSGQLEIPEGMKVSWEDTLCRRALEQNQFINRDVSTSWGDSQAARELGIQTYLSAPVRLPDGRIYGTLCGASMQSVQVADDVAETLTLFSDLIAWQLTRETKLTEQRLRADAAEARVEELMLLTDISTLCLDARELVPVLENIAGRLEKRNTWLQVTSFEFRDGQPIFHHHDQADRLAAVARDLGALSPTSTDEPAAKLLLSRHDSPQLVRHRRALGLPADGSTAQISAISDEGTEGGLLLFGNRQVPPEGNEARLLKSCANLLSLLADRMRHLEQLDQANRQLAIDALHDALTGLPNRRYLIAELGRMLAREVREDRALHVAFLDLDGFKQINDTYGHDAGDEFLKAVADRLTGMARGSDIVVRLGGDEFVVVASAGHSDTAEVECRHIAERITEATCGRYQLPDDITIDYEGPSIGCISTCDANADVDELLAKADAEMYRVKQQRRQRERHAI